MNVLSKIKIIYSERIPSFLLFVSKKLQTVQTIVHIRKTMPIFRLEGDDISKAGLILAKETNLELETHLESWLQNSPSALIQDELILWIGRQTSANVEDSTIFPDLLGIDSEGSLVIVEFKRGRTPREVVAQLLEYAAWANKLSDQMIQQIAKDYFETCEKYEGKFFYDAFRDMFDIPESEDDPVLNQHLRLFIVAENIPTRVADVCRFLRISHSMDISCINVSTYQTEAGERLVSMEAKVGDEDITTSITQKQRSSQTTQWSGDKPTKEVVRDIVQDLTGGDTDAEFTLSDVRKSVLEKYPNFSKNTLRYVMIEERVNDPAPNNHSITNPDGKYWWISKGKYRLYDPDKDKIEGDGRVNQTDSVTENPT